NKVPPACVLPNRTGAQKGVFRPARTRSASICERSASTTRTPARRLLRGALRASLREQLDGPVDRQRLDRLAAAEARVRLAVGDVAAEASFLDDDRPAARGIRPEVTQRRLGRTPRPSRLRLCQHFERVVEGDREQLLLALERPRLRPLADE